MRKILSIAATILFACFVPAVSGAQEATRDYFPGAPRGKLHLTLELQGSGRRDASNKVEWYRISANRKLEVELNMVLSMKGSIPSVKIAGLDKDSAPVPAGFTEITKALEACGENEACKGKAILAFNQQMMSNPQAIRAMQQDDTRYENWIVDRYGACANGTLIVEDQGDGVNIDPPSPARPYKFRRAGRLVLDPKNSSIMDRICEADIAVDSKKGVLSLRFKGVNAPVPVQLSGQAYTSEKSVPFLEGSSKIEVFDHNVDLNSGTWGGQRKLEKAASVSHNSGHTVAPMSGTLTWRFVRNPAP